MRRFPRLMRAIAYTLTLTTSLAPTYSYAAQAQNNTDLDDFSQLGRGGQSFGDSLRNEALSNPANVSGGSISLPSRGDDGSLTFDPNDQFSINELYPGTSASNSDSLDYYFSDSTKPDIGDIQGAYDSNAKMGEKGDHAKGSLYDDANSATPSISGAAYKVLVDHANASKPDFRNDPVLNLTKNTFENIDVISAGFGDCSAESSFEDIVMDIHNPKYEVCDRLSKPAGNCKIINEIKTKNRAVEVHVAAQGREILTVEFDLTKGEWNTVAPTDGVRFAGKVPKVDFDEVCENSKASGTEFVAGWDWVDHGLPGPVDTTVWYRSLQEPTCNNGLTGKVQIEDKQSGDDVDWVLGGKFSYHLKSITGNEWSTESCVEDAKKINDGFCQGSLEIISGAKNDSECINISGIEICPGDSFSNIITPAPIDGIPKLATELRLSEMQCDFNVGSMDCFIDVNGEEQCLDNDGGNNNSCKKYEDNPQCGFISSKCVDGAKGQSGECYVQEEVWDCGSSVQASTVEKKTKYECSGEIRCMGDDCLDPEQSENQSANFAKASALLNAAQFMTQDMVCSDGGGVGSDDDIDLGCTAFTGEAGECKVAVGGVSDCCEKPSNIGMSEYLSMIMAVPKLDAAIGSLSDTNIIKSSYQVIRQPVMDSWSVVTDPFTSHMDNISGAVTEFFEPVTALKDQLMDVLNEKMTSVIESVFGEVAKDTAIDAGVQAGASEVVSESVMANPASTMLGTLMSAYTAYVVTVAVIQMIYSCEKKELEMNAKRATDSCTHVGSYCKSKVLGVCIEKRQAYCCFNSPLSRIIQEQVRGQLGQGFGSAKHPSCEGIPLDKIADIDWDRINLDEWLAILQANGQFPDISNVEIDALTGSGSIFDIDGTRLPADQRAFERIGDVDIDGKRNEAMNKIGVNFKGTGNR